MNYRALKCPCGDPICTHWHVYPKLNVQGVALSEQQAKKVAELLNLMETHREVGFTHQGERCR